MGLLLLLALATAIGSALLVKEPEKSLGLPGEDHHVTGMMVNM